MRKIILASLVLVLLFLPHVLYGISFFGVEIKQEGAAGSGGGVFKSTNRGDAWQWKVLQRQIKKRLLTIGGIFVHDMIFDPQDSLTIYLTSYGQGLWVTYNGGGNWQQILGRGQTILGTAVDPIRRRLIYAAIGRRVFRSLNAGSTWSSALVGEPRIDSFPLYITSLAVDPKNPNKIYAGLNDGSIYLSYNYGRSWSIQARLPSLLIVKILINPRDSKIIYAASYTLPTSGVGLLESTETAGGLYKSRDGGKTWRFLSSLNKFSGANSYHELTFIPFQKDSLLYASNYGLLKSLDGGNKWTALPLLTPPNSVKIYSLAINSRNPLEIYYGTATNFYRSIDGGKSWITKTLPTTRASTVLLVDPLDQNIIYMGVASL